MQPDPLQLMTAAEVAALMSTTRRSLLNAVSRKRFLAGARIPGLGLRWRRGELQQWLDAAFRTTAAPVNPTDAVRPEEDSHA